MASDPSLLGFALFRFPSRLFTSFAHGAILKTKYHVTSFGRYVPCVHLRGAFLLQVITVTHNSFDTKPKYLMTTEALKV